MSMNLQTERLRPLPVRGDDVWQGGLFRIDTPVLDDDGQVVTPAGVLWASLATGKYHLGDLGPRESVTPAAVVTAMVEFATNPELAGFRPGRVEVADAAHAAALTDVFGPLGVDVAVVDDLPVVREMERGLADGMADAMPPTGAEPPPPLDRDRAVSPALVAGLADAAAVFCQAEPWKHFGPTDVIQVVSPRVEKAVKFVNVMGGGGEQFGLAFFPSKAGFLKLLRAAEPAAYAMRNAMVSCTLDDAEGLPEADVAAWKRLKAPVAMRDGRPVYPFPIRFEKGRWKRPTAAELTTMEGLLRAVAAAEPKDLATGRAVTVEVMTAGGPVAYRLKLTRVADPFGTPAAGEMGTAVTPTDALEAVFQSLVRDVSGDPPAGASAARRAAWGELRAAVRQPTLAAQRAAAAAAVAADPTMADAHVMAGVTAATPTAAAAAFKAAVDSSSTETDPHAFVRGLVGLSIAESSLGHTPVALTLLQQVADLIPTHPLAAELLGVGGRR